MFPLRDENQSREIPVVTYTLILLNVVIYLWDRQWNPFGPRILFTDLTLVPSAAIEAVFGGGDARALLGLFTSLFLHGSLLHLVMNMIFLITFGDNIEAAFGPVRFVIYYLFWGLMAGAAHTLVMPSSQIPTLGASGAIGGVLGAYFLLFPGHKISFVMFPFVFWPLEIAAWILLGGWFLFQILFPQQGVANWAHAGGFLAGMLTVLIAGGQRQVLAGRKFDGDDNLNYA